MTREQAFIVVNGKKVELLTPTSPPSAAVTQQPAGSLTTGVASTGAGSFISDQRALECGADNISQAMTVPGCCPARKKDGQGGEASRPRKSAQARESFRPRSEKTATVLLRSSNDFPINSLDKGAVSFIGPSGQTVSKLDMNLRDGASGDI